MFNAALPLSALSFKGKVIAAFTIAALVVVFFAWWRHAVYQRGYDDAMADVAAANGRKASEVRTAVERVRACRDRGRAWDQSRGLCEPR